MLYLIEERLGVTFTFPYQSMGNIVASNDVPLTLASKENILKQCAQNIHNIGISTEISAKLDALKQCHCYHASYQRQ